MPMPIGTAQYASVRAKAGVAQIQEEQAAFEAQMQQMIQINSQKFQKSMESLIQIIEEGRHLRDDLPSDSPDRWKETEADWNVEVQKSSEPVEVVGFGEKLQIQSSSEGSNGVEVDWNELNWLQRFRRVVIRIVNSTWFELGVSFVIVLNLFTIGIQAELELNGAQFPWMTGVERSFLFVYTVEATLRFVAKGPRIWLVVSFFFLYHPF